MFNSQIYGGHSDQSKLMPTSNSGHMTTPGHQVFVILSVTNDSFTSFRLDYQQIGTRYFFNFSITLCLTIGLSTTSRKCTIIIMRMPPSPSMLNTVPNFLLIWHFVRICLKSSLQQELYLLSE